jgi:hypothetical protein
MLPLTPERIWRGDTVWRFCSTRAGVIATPKRPPAGNCVRWGPCAATASRALTGALPHDRTSAKSSLGDAKSSLGDAKSSLGDAKSSLGDAKSSLSDAKSSLGDAESSLGDAKSSLGDVKSSLGDAKSFAE